MENRFIEVKAEIRVVIDRKLVEELGVSEDEVRRFIQNRLSSLSHRFSTWLTETISSSLMLSKMTGKKQVALEAKQEKEGDVEVIEKNGTFYIIPNETYNKYSRSRKYLKYRNRLIPLRLTRKRGVRNPEAVAILRDLMARHGKIRLRILKANYNSVVLGLIEEDVVNAEDKNRSL